MPIIIAGIYAGQSTPHWPASAMASTGKRASYTAGFKLKVVETAEKCGNRAAGREHSVNEKLVRDWRKKKAELKALPRFKRSLRVGAKPHWAELESKVTEWVLDKHMNGIGLSGTMIRLKAKLIAQEMPPEEVEDFTVSTSWLYRFMKRQKTKIAQRLPQEFEDKIIGFHRMMIRMCQMNNYEIQQLGNMDETPMNFDMPPSRTVNPVGEKTIMIKTTGNGKKNILLCFSMSS